jgi:hypothetical protein
MRQVRQTRRPRSKHLHTYPFVKPDEVTEILAPKKVIEADPLSILSELINRHPGNCASVVTDGMLINGVRILLWGGICQFGTTRFRYTDYYSLLMELKKERVLCLAKDEIKDIQHRLSNV